MKFQTETVRILTELGNHDVEGDLIRYDDVYVGGWRWGDRRMIVFGPNREDGGKYAYTYKISSGDGDYVSWDDEGAEIEAWPVKGIPVTTVTWEPL